MQACNVRSQPLRDIAAALAEAGAGIAGAPRATAQGGRRDEAPRILFNMSVESAAAQTATSDRLIEQCLEGDQAAWDTIVRQNWRRVFNVAYKFVGRHDEAEDLAQDIFLKIFKALGTFDRRANFQTWIVSISRNLCIDHYRSVRKERQTIAREVDSTALQPASTERSPHAAAEHQDLRELLRTALGKLPPPLRAAVVLRDLQELSYQEIADRLRLPEGTVKSRINRGRIELARQLRRMEHATAPPPRRDMESGAIE
jgi:RNA polymerase sigma-70 factor, ECF subfamily